MRFLVAGQHGISNKHHGKLRCLRHRGGDRSSRNAEVLVNHWLTPERLSANFHLRLNLTSIRQLQQQIRHSCAPNRVGSIYPALASTSERHVIINRQAPYLAWSTRQSLSRGCGGSGEGATRHLRFSISAVESRGSYARGAARVIN